MTCGIESIRGAGDVFFGITKQRYVFAYASAGFSDERDVDRIFFNYELRRILRMAIPAGVCLAVRGIF